MLNFWSTFQQSSKEEWDFETQVLNLKRNEKIKNKLYFGIKIL